MLKEFFINSRLPVKVLGVGAVVLLAWWLWPVSAQKSVAADKASKSGNLVSAIQPVSEAEASNIERGSVSGQLKPLILDSQANDDLKSRFELAVTDIEAKNPEQAVTRLNELIIDYPGVPELYANLGAVYARQGDLEQARQAFKNGLEQNQKSRTLFDGLQEVHGALAASAYQKALDATSPLTKPSPVTLPLIAEVSTALDQEQTIAALQDQLNAKQQPDASIELEKIAKLQAELDLSAQNLLANKSDYEAELQQLRNQLAAQSKVLVLSQTAEREAQARVVRAEESASTQLNEAITRAETEKQTLLKEKDAVIARQQNELALMRKQSAAQVAAQQVARQQAQQPANENTDRKAMELVKSWARVWSRQDVAAYVDHYVAGYSSGSSISREEWLEQRRVRLTNKEFIEVDVREFVIQDMGERFAVTFTQHYRSNTVDDTIRKRLVFSKQGDDWSLAKIVNESRVAN